MKSYSDMTVKELVDYSFMLRDLCNLERDESYKLLLNKITEELNISDKIVLNLSKETYNTSDDFKNNKYSITDYIG